MGADTAQRSEQSVELALRFPPICTLAEAETGISTSHTAVAPRGAFTWIASNLPILIGVALSRS
jgi:hypothetical protein